MYIHIILQIHIHVFLSVLRFLQVPSVDDTTKAIIVVDELLEQIGKHKKGITRYMKRLELLVE